ncbi:MAG: KilA-N domain-containing protein, partial [Planktothrix sp.]
MTSTLVFHSANDSPIGQRRGDGYFNATALCKAAGKRWDNYRTHEGFQPFIEALGRSLNLSDRELIQAKKGGKASEQGTWVHPQVAVHLAMWLSPEFSVLVTQWVVLWMSGTDSQPQSQPSEPAQLKNWTPPELYPQMTQAEFEAIPVDEQWIYLETPQERRQRQRQELR